VANDHSVVAEEANTARGATPWTQQARLQSSGAEQTAALRFTTPFALPLRPFVCKQGKRSGRSSPTDQVSATHDGAGDTARVKCEAKRNARFFDLDDRKFPRSAALESTSCRDRSFVTGPARRLLVRRDDSFH
jgi:hypothetical protein